MSSAAIEQDVCVALFMQTLPAAKSKLLVDMVNCLQVSNDQLRVQTSRENSFLDRMFDSMTGQGYKRGNRIAENQQTALTSVLEVVNDLATHTTRSHWALAQVAGRLTAVELGLAHTANKLSDTREALQDLRNDVKNHVRRIDQDLVRIDLHATAKDEMDLVFSRWQANKLETLSIAARCYASFNELYWGAFGEFCRRHPGNRSHMLIETVKNRASTQMQADAKADTRQHLPAAKWLASAATHDAAGQTFLDGLVWLGNQATMKHTPAVYVCSNPPSFSSFNSAHWPQNMPLIFQPERLVNMLGREIFAPIQLAGVQ